MTASEREAFWSRRDSLLGGRAAGTLTPDEVRAAAAVICGDPALFRLYDNGVEDLVSRGFRLAARTAVECCVDAEARPLARALRTVWSETAGGVDCVVLDPFAGSGNLLHWVAGALGGEGIGFEQDEVVFAATRHNLALAGSTVRLVNASGTDAAPAALAREKGLVVLLDPPWAAGFTPDRGLDLFATEPPVRELVDWVRTLPSDGPVLVVLKASEHMDLGSWRLLGSLPGTRLLSRLRSEDPNFRTVFCVFSVETR